MRAVVIQKVSEEKGNYGFNARTEQYGDLLEAGIIDPTKVARVALENAASVAGMLLTTECVIAEKPEKIEIASVRGTSGMNDLDY